MGGEEADCLNHRWLEKTSVDRVCAAVRGEGLAVGEETRQDSRGKYTLGQVCVIREGVQTYSENKYHNSRETIYDSQD